MITSSNIGRILEGKYEIIRTLGEGGMGEVYEARHRLINRKLAVKLLREEYARDEEIVERFIREARASAAIGHDHIVEITDMGVVESGELFIVMEYLEGKDLETLLREEGLLSVSSACHIMIQVLSALEAAHGKGIVHRDLKPANIFLTTHIGISNYAKIVDFGISKVRSNEVDVTRGLTKTGILLGTPTYMSPEQAMASRDITQSTDIFAAGVILYEMVTGKRPFGGASITLILAKILKEQPPDPREYKSDIPELLCQIIKKAMEKDPGSRFPDAASFRREITRFSPGTAELTGLASTRLSARASQHKPQSFEGAMKAIYATNSNSLSETTPMNLALTSSIKIAYQRRWRLYTAVLLGLVIAVLIGIVVARILEDEMPETNPIMVPLTPEPSYESIEKKVKTVDSKKSQPLVLDTDGMGQAPPKTLPDKRVSSKPVTAEVKELSEKKVDEEEPVKDNDSQSEIEEPAKDNMSQREIDEEAPW